MVLHAIGIWKTPIDYMKELAKSSFIVKARHVFPAALKWFQFIAHVFLQPHCSDDGLNKFVMVSVYGIEYAGTYRFTHPLQNFQEVDNFVRK